MNTYLRKFVSLFLTIMFANFSYGKIYYTDYSKKDLTNEKYARGNKPVLTDSRLVFVEELNGVTAKDLYWRAHNILTNLMSTTVDTPAKYLNKFTLLQEGERIQLDGGYNYCINTTFAGFSQNADCHQCAFKLVMEFKDNKYRIILYDFTDGNDIHVMRSDKKDEKYRVYQEKENSLYHLPDADKSWDKYFDKNNNLKNKDLSFNRMAFIDLVNYIHDTIVDKMKSPVNENSDKVLKQNDEW